MTWQAALEVVVSRTKHERCRWLCSDTNPDVQQRDAYRALMIRVAQQPNPSSALRPPPSALLDVTAVDRAYAEMGTGPLPGGCCG